MSAAVLNMKPLTLTLVGDSMLLRLLRDFKGSLILHTAGC